MAKKLDLDRFDLRLLELLQEDAQQAVPLLAEKVGLSRQACYRRIKRLREEGAIEREIAIVPAKTMGWPLSMIVLVSLEREGARTISDIIRKLNNEPTVLDVWHVTGDHDFAIRMIAQDMASYDGTVTRLFSEDDRIRSFETLVVIRSGKSMGPIPAVD